MILLLTRGFNRNIVSREMLGEDAAVFPILSLTSLETPLWPDMHIDCNQRVSALLLRVSAVLSWVSRHASLWVMSVIWHRWPLKYYVYILQTSFFEYIILLSIPFGSS